MCPRSKPSGIGGETYWVQCFALAHANEFSWQEFTTDAKHWFSSFEIYKAGGEGGLIFWIPSPIQLLA